MAPNNLTPKDHDRIRRLLSEDPVDTYEYFIGPESQRLNSPSTLQTVVYRKGGEIQLWSNDSDSGLQCHGTFASMDQALGAERVLVTRILRDADDYFTAQLDEEWASRPVCQANWEYPLRFEDNTDFTNGWELKSWPDVLDFFQRIRPHVFEDLPSDSIYWWGLTDASGRACRPVRSHRGVIRLEEPERSEFEQI